MRTGSRHRTILCSELKAGSAPWVAAEKELANANKVIPNLHLWGSSELPRAPIKNAKKYKMAEAFLFCGLFVPDVMMCKIFSGPIGHLFLELLHSIKSRQRRALHALIEILSKVSFPSLPFFMWPFLEGLMAKVQACGPPDVAQGSRSGNNPM